jgi:putative membrane protein
MTRKSVAPIRKPRSFPVETDEESALEKPTKTKPPRKPQAMETGAKLVILPDEAVDEAYQRVDKLTPPVPQSTSPAFGWGKLALGAISALIALAAGLAVDALIRDLFSRNDWLGWAALSIAGIAAFALLAVVFREIRAISRLATMERLRKRGVEAKKAGTLETARNLVRDMVGLYQSRPDTAHGRSQLAEHAGEIMDGSDLVALIERDLLAPLDKVARGMVMESAKRVSVVTAVSPRALVDVGFVLYENMRLIRRICEHYGGRPGTLSSFRLVRVVLTHLAATGAIAVGDGLMQQVIGQGLAARLSARLGEGVVNGLLTARIGIAAIDVCRPLLFDAEKRPGVSDFLSELSLSLKSDKE